MNSFITASIQKKINLFILSGGEFMFTCLSPLASLAAAILPEVRLLLETCHITAEVLKLHV